MGSMKEHYYEQNVGFKDPAISQENARRIKADHSATMLRAKVLALYRGGFTGTADEAAAALQLDVLRIRPRCTELIKMNKLERTPLRRRSSGGGIAAVLRARITV